MKYVSRRGSRTTKWRDVDALSLGPLASDLDGLGRGAADMDRWQVEGVGWHDKPTYRRLTIQELQQIRRTLYSRSTDDWTRAGLESMLRFCEINMFDLHRRMTAVWGSDLAPTAAVLTSACLIEAAIVNRDPRFLNAVLKIRGKRSLFPSWAKMNGERGNRVIDLASAIVSASEAMCENW
jgi:hypothetical protein